MALINRMSRLLTADLHAVLDRVEEPAALLRQAIREMEDAVADGERRMKALEGEREALTDRRAKVEAALSGLDSQLDVCFGSDNEALMRKLLRRKLESERFAQHLTERADVLDKQLAAARASLVDQREQLDVTRQKAELLTENVAPAAHGFVEDPSATRITVGDDEVEVAFLRERQRRRPS